MTLNQLKYFCEVARTHSITRAAENLYVSQPAVSLALKELEKEFQIHLFVHGKNKITLTEEGDAFYRRAAALLKNAHELEEAFSESGRTSHPIRIGIPPMISTVFFPRLTNAFQEEYDLPVQLFEYGSVRASELVQSEEIDCAIVNLNYYHVDQFNFHKMMTDRYVYCVSRTHRYAGEKSVNFEMLTDEPIILYNTDSVQNAIIRDRFRALGIAPNILMHCSQLYTILNYVRSGTCGAFLYSTLPVNPRDFVSLPVESEITNDFGIIWKKGVYISDATLKFIRFAEKYDLSPYIPSDSR